MKDIINSLLEEYHDRLDTRAIIIQEAAIEAAADALRSHLDPGKWLVAADFNTWKVAGARVAALLDGAGFEWELFDVTVHPEEDYPTCDDARVDTFQAALESTGSVAGIAVGAGTINDIVKLASFRQGVSMAVFCTAPSMNGYTSGIAAVLSEGVKTTVPCTAPRVIVADLEILAESPQRMIQSGLGDLLSKPVSNSDWALSAFLIGSHHSSEAMSIIEQGSAMLNGVAPKLPEKDFDAVAGLTGSLMLSGLAMSVAGSSSPASGGEHLISHYIDMTSHSFSLPHDFHGCQVGVGTLTTAHLYERLKALDPSEIDIDTLVADLLPWESYKTLLETRFGVLFDAVVKHAELAYPTPEVLRARLTKLVDHWDDVMVRISETLRTRADIESELIAANCPVRFSELGVDGDRALAAVLHSKDIRNRYTILHLAWELGHLDDWAGQALEILH